MNGQDTAVYPVRFFRLFLDSSIAELGREALEGVLERANLPVDLIDPRAVQGYDSQSATQTYAQVQKAMRVYFGRGARGTLIRIGRSMWVRWLETASLSDRTQFQLMHSLPAGMRPKAALELLAHFMRQKSSAVRVHALDMGYRLVDHTSVAKGQAETNPICYVTLGLIEENLYWATAREHDIDEISCCANEGQTCEFRIKLEGKQ